MAGCQKKNSKLQESHYKRYAVEGKAGINRYRRMQKELSKQSTISRTIEKG